VQAIRICDRLGVELREAGRPAPWLTHGFDHLLRTPGLSAGFLLGAVSVFTAFCISGFLELRIPVRTMTGTRAGPRRLSEVGCLTSRGLDAGELSNSVCMRPLEFWMEVRVLGRGWAAFARRVEKCAGVGSRASWSPGLTE
jgi:hypothetical protein